MSLCVPKDCQQSCLRPVLQVQSKSLAEPSLADALQPLQRAMENAASSLSLPNVYHKVHPSSRRSLFRSSRMFKCDEGGEEGQRVRISMTDLVCLHRDLGLSAS